MKRATEKQKAAMSKMHLEFNERTTIQEASSLISEWIARKNRSSSALEVLFSGGIDIPNYGWVDADEYWESEYSESEDW